MEEILEDNQCDRSDSIKFDIEQQQMAGEQLQLQQQQVEPDPKRIKRARKRKQPHKTRMITGYIIYASEIRKDIIRQYPEKDFGDISRLVGVEWKNLPQERKVTYEKRAQEQNNLAKMLVAEEAAAAAAAACAPELEKLADAAAAVSAATEQEQLQQQQQHHHQQNFTTSAQHQAAVYQQQVAILAQQHQFQEQQQSLPMNPYNCHQTMTLNGQNCAPPLVDGSNYAAENCNQDDTYKQQAAAIQQGFQFAAHHQQPQPQQQPQHHYHPQQQSPIQTLPPPTETPNLSHCLESYGQNPMYSQSIINPPSPFAATRPPSSIGSASNNNNSSTANSNNNNSNNNNNNNNSSNNNNSNSNSNSNPLHLSPPQQQPLHIIQQQQQQQANATMVQYCGGCFAPGGVCLPYQTPTQTYYPYAQVPHSDIYHHQQQQQQQQHQHQQQQQQQQQQQVQLQTNNLNQQHQFRRNNIIYRKPAIVKLRPKDATTQTEPIKWIEKVDSQPKKALKFSQKFIEYLNCSSNEPS